jgi:cation transport regulator ChaC
LDLSTEIASDFTAGDYHNLRDRLQIESAATPEWERVLGAFQKRIRERFLLPIAALACYDATPWRERPMRSGFAILTLDCLLIDTLQSFREGRIATGETSSAQSFKSFLKATPFSDFKSQDRSDFYSYVRNALLHNGETRQNWKIRINPATLLTKDPATGTRTLNRRLFHEGVVIEYDEFCSLLRRTESVGARKLFLKRMDALCDWPATPLKCNYFAYGSNLLENEIRKKLNYVQLEPYERAYLPGWRLVFDKHSQRRLGDAANLVQDSTSMVWGFVYRLDERGVALLEEQERGYQQERVDVRLQSVADTPSDVAAFTFVSKSPCPEACGPPSSYLNLIISGAEHRQLPADYIEWLRSEQR